MRVEAAAGAVETTPRPQQSKQVARRLALAGTIPAMDAVAILAAVGLYERSTTVGLLYGAVVFCLPMCSRSQRLSINPRLEREIPTLLACTTVPFIAIAIFASEDPAELKSVAPGRRGSRGAGHRWTGSILSGYPCGQGPEHGFRNPRPSSVLAKWER